VGDAAEHPSLADLRHAVEREGIRALGFFPLVGRDGLLGKFMVYFDEPHLFTEVEVDLAQAIGAHVALEIDRVRAEEESRRTKETERSARGAAERLLRVVDALSTAGSEQEAAQVVVREVSAALDASAGWVALLDGPGDQLVRVGAVGYRAELEAAYASLPL